MVPVVWHKASTGLSCNFSVEARVTGIAWIFFCASSVTLDLFRL